MELSWCGIVILVVVMIDSVITIIIVIVAIIVAIIIVIAAIVIIIIIIVAIIVVIAAGSVAIMITYVVTITVAVAAVIIPVIAIITIIVIVAVIVVIIVGMIDIILVVDGESGRFERTFIGDSCLGWSCETVEVVVDLVDNRVSSPHESCATTRFADDSRPDIIRHSARSNLSCLRFLLAISLGLLFHPRSIFCSLLSIFSTSELHGKNKHSNHIQKRILWICRLWLLIQPPCVFGLTGPSDGEILGESLAAKDKHCHGNTTDGILRHSALAFMHVIHSKDVKVHIIFRQTAEEATCARCVSLHFLSCKWALSCGVIACGETDKASLTVFLTFAG